MIKLRTKPKCSVLRDQFETGPKTQFSQVFADFGGGPFAKKM